jgi:hypothetical protein
VWVRWGSRLFVQNKVRATDGALEFVEQGCESNSNRARTGLANTVAPTSGDSFLWVLSLSAQRKYLGPGGPTSTFFSETKYK